MGKGAFQLTGHHIQEGIRCEQYQGTTGVASQGGAQNEFGEFVGIVVLSRTRIQMGDVETGLFAVIEGRFEAGEMPFFVFPTLKTVTTGEEVEIIIEVKCCRCERYRVEGLEQGLSQYIAHIEGRDLVLELIVGTSFFQLKPGHLIGVGFHREVFESHHGTF